MKHIILLILLLQSGVIFCQTTSAVIKTDTSHKNLPHQWVPDSNNLKPGFYKSYKEFITNSPSIIRNITVVTAHTREDKKAAGVVEVSFTYGDGDVPIDEYIWGFSDGKSLYIPEEHSPEYYYKVEYIGPYSFFIRDVEVSGDITRPVIFVLEKTLFPYTAVYFINKNGKLKKANTKHLTELFFTEPDILQAFLNDTDKENKIKKYLIEFNERLRTKH